MAERVQGSTANTGRAVLRLNKAGRAVSLLLPLETDLATRDGLATVNERFRQIEERLAHAEDTEVKLATKLGFGALDPVASTAKPVTGAKVSLDKTGTWLLLATWEWSGSGEAEGYIVLDPETEAGAKRQDARVRATGTGTTTAWCLFTATDVPRLAQLYAKVVSGSWVVAEAGTAICAIWLGKWEAGEKRFGRHTASQFTGALDMKGGALTDHGEEARWPYGDDPDTLSNGVDQTGL